MHQPIEDLIQHRRAIYPHLYNDEEISQEELSAILENARWAPTHRLTQPWRFIIFRKDALKDLSKYLGSYYQKHTLAEDFSDRKYDKTIKNPLRSGAVIAIVLHRDPEGRVPEWEELAAVAMAVQNIWLSCSARGIGAYWSSPKSIQEASSFLGLKDNEKCLGLFYMGKTDIQPPAPARFEQDKFVREFNS